MINIWITLIMTSIRKFRKVLRNDEVKDIDTVKEYLEFSFKKRRSKKDYKVYINVCKIYNIYPNTIKELLNNIPKLGYYKDYFYVLMFSRNVELSDYIYDIVIKQLNDDLANLKENKKISTMGKWLPRESSKINKTCNFIDTFNSKFYPDKEKFNARKRYRKLKTMLNSKIGTLEAKICTHQMDTIDFNKVSRTALKRNKSTLLKNEVSKEKLESHIKSTITKMSLSNFVKEIMINNHNSEMIQDIWEHNRFSMELPYFNRLVCNSVCIIDLSKDTYNNDSQYFTIGIALLIDLFSTLENKVFVCNNNLVKLNGSIKEKIDQLTKYCGPCKQIDITRYYDLVTKNNAENQCKNIFFVTNKDISNLEWLLDKKMTLVQFKPQYDEYDIVYYNGDKETKFKKYMTNNYDSDEIISHEKKSKNINDIINKSNELNDRQTPINIILLMLFLFSILKSYEYFSINW